MMSARPRSLALLCAVLVLAACATESKTDAPAELTVYPSSVRVERLWSTRVGATAPKLKLGLAIATDGQALFTANHSGDVMAFSLANGRRLWSTPTRLAITGGPGVGEGLVVAGAENGNIVALDAATGEIKWKASINSEILAAPSVGNQVVLLRGVDGRLVALRASDGTEMWMAEQQVPRLSLRGTAQPLVAGTYGISGFDNGRVMAVDLDSGDTAWDAIVAPSSGRTELERLNDVDMQVAVRDDEVFAVNFHGKVARLDLQSGEIVWSRDASSYTGLVLDQDSLYFTDAAGKVLKHALGDGIQTWSNDELANRRLSPPALLGDYVVVTDFEGYVHFIDRASGKLAARALLMDDRVTAQPVVNGDRLYLLDAAGKLVALRATTVAAGTGTTTAGGTGVSGARETVPLRPR